MVALFLLIGLMSDTQTAPNLCVDRANCREVGELEIRTDGQTLTARINETIPFVADNGLTLFAGESVVVIVSDTGALTVESHEQADAVVTPEKLRLAVAEMNAVLAHTGGDLAPGTISAVPDERPPARLRISLMQVPGSVETVLLVENGYSRQIDYQAEMQVPGARGPQSTTVCEILPGLMALEHWPHPIAAITLDNFRIVPASGGTTCD